MQSCFAKHFTVSSRFLSTLHERVISTNDFVGDLQGSGLRMLGASSGQCWSYKPSILGSEPYLVEDQVEAGL